MVCPVSIVNSFSRKYSPRSRRAISVNTELLKTGKHQNRTIYKVTKAFNTNHTAIKKHLPGLKKVCKPGQLVTHHLTDCLIKELSSVSH